MSDFRSDRFSRALFDTTPVQEVMILKTIGTTTYKWKCNVRKKELPRWLSMTIIQNYITDEPKETRTMTVEQLKADDFVGIWTRID